MQALLILVALIAGLALGVAGAGAQWGGAIEAVADPIGGLWLNALKMTIVPLVVSLLITGILKTAEGLRAGMLAARSVITFLIVLWLSAIMAALVTPALLSAFPLPAENARALKAGLAQAATVPAPPAWRDFILSLVPANPLAAASNDAIVPLVIFTLVLAFAIARLPAEKRAPLAAFFDALGDAMLIVIGWVLKLAPVGVFALAIVLGARTGFSALGALAHYVLIVSALGLLTWASAYPLAIIGGGVPLGKFARAMLPSQAVALSTQSSLASLPAMLRACEAIGIRPATADTVLPLAVALFRATGPCMNLTVALYVAHWYGIPLGPAQLAAGVALAATTTLAAVSLPGQISFISSIGPIALAMGVPFEPLAILVAVETIPDILRTIGNVNMDVAVTSMIEKRERAAG
jgi:proton glutamate symport protein